MYSVTSKELNEKSITISYLGKFQISGNFWKIIIHMSDKITRNLENNLNWRAANRVTTSTLERTECMYLALHYKGYLAVHICKANQLVIFLFMILYTYNYTFSAERNLPTFNNVTVRLSVKASNFKTKPNNKNTHTHNCFTLVKT